MKKTLIIAEAGVNHNGDFETAKRLIEVASEAGSDFVKFQTFNADEIVIKSAKQARYQTKNIGVTETQHKMLQRLELDRKHHSLLIAYSKKCGIEFLSTAFDIDSLAFLDSLGSRFIKIPSGEITNLPYLKAVASYNKPIILSTGMSTIGDIENAFFVLEKFGATRKNITILHCTSEYPAPMDEINLNVINSLRTAFEVEVGYSDHTMGIEVPIAAVTLGATVIEKHFTLDRTMVGPDHTASLEPDELKKMVSCIRNIELAIGDGIKRISPSEKKNITIVRKSLVSKCLIKKGDAFTIENLGVKRPGTGISPMKFEETLGKIAFKDFHADEIIDF